MASLTGFNAADIDTTNTMEPVAPGKHLAIITDSEMVSTSSGNGRMLVFTIEIIDGKFSGRTLRDRLNIENPSKAAVEIARKTLASICKAVGVLTPDDSAELHGRPITIVVKHRVRQDTGGTVADVVGYDAAEMPAAIPRTAPAERPAIQQGEPKGFQW